MGKIVMMMGLSLDGFFEGPNRELDWHQVDEEVHARFNHDLAQAGAFIDGRVTWEGMMEFWPEADQDPENPPVIREFAAIWRNANKYVVSTTLQEAGWGTKILREVVPKEIRAIADGLDGDLMLGGGQLSRTFIELDLVDQYLIILQPVVLGRGNRFFGEVDRQTPLRLVDNHTFSNGVVQLRYERVRAA